MNHAEIVDVLADVLAERPVSASERHQAAQQLRAVTDALVPGIGPMAALSGHLLAAADLLDDTPTPTPAPPVGSGAVAVVTAGTGPLVVAVDLDPFP